MQHIETSIITANKSPEDLIKLNELDILTGHPSTAGVYYFKSYPDLEKLKVSLRKALDMFPTYGASLLRKNNDIYIFRNNIGINFSIFKWDQPCPDFDTLEPLEHQTPLLSPPPSPPILNGDTPLTSLRVVLYNNDAWALGVRNIHSLVDAAAFCHFLQAWGQIYRGETPEPPVLFPRDNISRLASGNGHLPSPKLKLLPIANFSLGKQFKENQAQYGYSDVDVDALALENAVAHCKSACREKLTSSDVIQAIAWKAFALSCGLDEKTPCTVYTICDLKRIEELGIPERYEGNANIERFATLPIYKMRRMSVAEIARQFHLQIKPITRKEIQQDIAYLQRELELGNIRESNGAFKNFVRASMIDCLEGNGIMINDYRFLEAKNVAFDSRTKWFETLQGAGFCSVIIYPKPNGEITFRYTGFKNTLAEFSQQVRSSLHHLSLETA